MRKDRLLKQLLRERFVFTLRGGESFEGLLVDADTKTIQLVDSYALGVKNRAAVDGDLFIPRSEVIYIQRPGAHS